MEAASRRTDRPAAQGGLLTNAGALLASRLLVAALGWGGTVMIVRDLTDEAFGQFALIFSILGMLSIVTDMGIGRVAVAGVSVEDPVAAGEFAGSYIVLRTVLGVLGYALALGFVVVMDYPPEVVRGLAVGGVSVLLATPVHALAIVFQVQLRMQRVAVAAVVGQVAQFALTAAIAARGGSLLAFAVPAVLFELVTMLLLVPQAHRLLPIRYRVQPAQWRRLIREALPLSIGTAFATLYYRVDSVMLSRLDDFASVGTYNVAYKFADVVHFASTAVTMPLLTLLVRSWPHDPATFRHSLRRAGSILSIVALLAFVEFLLFAEPVIGLLYGDDYRDGAAATVLLVSAEVLSFATSLAFVVLTATAHHRIYPFVALGGLVVNVLLNLLFIPAWSFDGAAIATLLTEVAVAVALYNRLLQVPHVRPLPLSYLPRTLLTAALALGIGMVAGAAGIPWFVGGVLVAVAYGVGLHVLRAPGPQGLRSLGEGAP